MSALLYGLSLGLAAVPGCLGHCLPMLLFLTLEQAPGPGAPHAPWRVVLARCGAFLAGRFLAYLAAALVVGLAGAALAARGVLQGPAARVLWQVTDVAVLAFVVFSALRLLDLLPRSPRKGGRGCPTRSERAARRLATPWGGLALGFVAGLAPCAPFFLVVGRGVQTADPLATSLLFLGFYVATSLPMLLLLSPRLARDPGRVRSFAGALNLAIAMLLVSRFL